ncbi:MAG: ABC transporter substrate-binding protein [Alphaproteobacteria bacterium]
MHRLVLLCAALLLSFPARASELEKVIFCRPQSLASELAYIAEQKGYFREQGLDVEFLPSVSGKICQDNLVAGKADFGYVGDGPISYLGFHDHGLRVLAQVQRNPEQALIARRDHGIAREADIKGKRIGYLPGTTSYFYLARLLDKLGLRLDEVKLQPLQPPAMPRALEGGVIDAFVVWEPWGSQAMRLLGDKGIRLRDKTLYDWACLLVATKAMTDERPATVEKLLKAMLKAEAYIRDNTEAVIPLLAETVKMDIEVVKLDWPDFDHGIKLDRSLTGLLAANAHYILRDDANFKDKPMPDFRKSFEPKFLRAVAPERVQEGF